MDDTTVALIIEAARALPLEEQGQWIARQAIVVARAADAGISDQALEAELRAWWKAEIHPLTVPSFHAVTTHMAWGRHLLRGGRQAVRKLDASTKDKSFDSELSVWISGVRNA